MLLNCSPLTPYIHTYIRTYVPPSTVCVRMYVLSPHYIGRPSNLYNCYVHLYDNYVYLFIHVCLHVHILHLCLLFFFLLICLHACVLVCLLSVLSLDQLEEKVVAMQELYNMYEEGDSGIGLEDSMDPLVDFEQHTLIGEA